MTSRRLGGWAVVALLACVAFGIFTAWPFLWNVLGVLWFVHLRREMKVHRAANPAPPPGREGAVITKPQVVTYWGNGAGMTIMPATTEGDTTHDNHRPRGVRPRAHGRDAHSGTGHDAGRQD